MDLKLVKSANGVTNITDYTHADQPYSLKVLDRILREVRLWSPRVLL